MKILSSLSLAGLFLLSAPVFASHCPADVEKIDAALEAGTNLDEAQLAEVKALRDEGASLHEAGNHGESVEALHKALEILGQPHDS